MGVRSQLKPTFSMISRELLQLTELEPSTVHPEQITNKQIVSSRALPSTVTLGEPRVRTRTSVSPPIRIVGQTFNSGYQQRIPVTSSPEYSSPAIYQGQPGVRQFRDIAYDKHPLVEQDEYFRKVVTHPGVQYQVPLHNETLRNGSTQGWVRAVHYPVATDLFRQVPFKTEHIDKTYSRYTPDSSNVVEQGRIAPTEEARFSNQKKLLQSVDLTNEIGELSGLLQGNPNLAREVKELFCQRGVPEVMEGNKRPVKYPKKEDIDNVVDHIIDGLDLENMQLTKTETTVEKIKTSGVHNPVNGQQFVSYFQL